MMKQGQTVFMAGALGALLVLAPGCSKQLETKSGSAEFEQGAAKPKEPASSGQAGQGNGPLKGFESAAPGKALSEERSSEGIMVAKADTGDAARRQAEELRKDQAATAQAGLKDIYFAYDAWKITDEARQALILDAEWMKANKAQPATVEGHCDERGTQAYNLVLGEKRAKAALNYLVELGVAKDRLSVASFGKERPACQDHAESCYQQNRRAHIVLKGQ
ncbi:MAG: OmpA family protein [Nitrospirae bacterium]|nr:OmpA family protein [Nitrospirota bacterium]